MKRAILALSALVLVASSTGCCCLDRLFCWGCHGGCPNGGCCGDGYYGNEGPGGGCSDCGNYGGGSGGMGGPSGYSGPAERGGYPPRAVVRRRPAAGHPMAHQRRDAGGEYEFAAGPPTGGTTYPYYTTRGPRDFLARNPRDIGP